MLITPTNRDGNVETLGIDPNALVYYDRTALVYNELDPLLQSACASQSSQLEYLSLPEGTHSTSTSVSVHSQPTMPIDHDSDLLICGCSNVLNNKIAMATHLSNSISGCCPMTVVEDSPTVWSSNDISDHSLYFDVEAMPHWNATHTSKMLVSCPPIYSNIADNIWTDPRSDSISNDVWQSFDDSHQELPAWNNDGSGLFLASEDVSMYQSVNPPSHRGDIYGSSMETTLNSITTFSSSNSRPQEVESSPPASQDDYIQHQNSCVSGRDFVLDKSLNGFGNTVAPLIVDRRAEPLKVQEATLDHFGHNKHQWSNDNEINFTSQNVPQSLSDVKNSPTTSLRGCSPNISSDSSKKDVWLQHFAMNGEIEVSYTGQKFVIDSESGSVTFEKSKDTKPNRCAFVYKNGDECGVRFKASEHLRRHMGKHLQTRSHRCPVQGCMKKIQRSDNARDHFKTHLRPGTRGRRNRYVRWCILRRAIGEEYEDKESAQKLINQLEQWIDAGMPGRSENQGRGGPLRDYDI